MMANLNPMTSSKEYVWLRRAMPRRVTRVFASAIMCGIVQNFVRESYQTPI